MTVWFISRAAGLSGCCIAKVLASHLVSALDSRAGENQVRIASNIVAEENGVDCLVSRYVERKESVLCN